MTRIIRMRPAVILLIIGLLFGLVSCNEALDSGASQSPVTIAGGNAETASYRRVENWPQLPPGKELLNVAGVAVDAEGVIYTFQRGSLPGVPAAGRNEILMFDRDGRYLGVWGPSADPGFVKAAHALHIDSEGFFWVVDRDGHQVKKFHPDGTLLMTVGNGEFGNTPETFNGPTTVAFLDNGDFIVADGYWNSRIVWFNAAGQFLKQLGGEYGRGPGKLGGVHAAVVDSRGRLLVVDRCSGASQPTVTQPGQVDQRRVTDCNEVTDDWIQIFDHDANFLTYWTHVRRPLSLTVVGERIYAADDRRNIVVLNAESGDIITRIADVSRGDLHQIAVDQHGDVYAASLGTAGTVGRFTRDVE